MMMLNSKVSSVNHLLSTGLSPARAEGRCAAKKMAKNEVPPQIFSNVAFISYTIVGLYVPPQSPPQEVNSWRQP